MKNVQLVTTKTAVGRGANDGVYYPGGLLTIAAALRSAYGQAFNVWVDDQHHTVDGTVPIRSDAEIVGVQVASTLTYQNALAVAEEAKAKGKVIVLGGPHVSSVYEQIMRKRPFVDFLIRGKGEESMVQLVEALDGRRVFESVESLSWRRGGEIVHNPERSASEWKYDRYTPLPLELLSAGLPNYWEAYRRGVNAEIDAAFLIFTHFGCGYRAQMVRKMENRGLPVFGNEVEASFCSYCSLADAAQTREPARILEEVHHYLTTCNLPTGSHVHLKCYGDNIGPLRQFVRKLRRSIDGCPWWGDYHLTWTFYCQSSYLTEELADDLRVIGTSALFIGFDGANDIVQRQNGLGTTLATHLSAIEICGRHNLKIQAGSVVGLRGETPSSLEEMYRFCKELAASGVLKSINSAILFVIPGTPAFELLANREPWIRHLDLLPTTRLRDLWIKHFCPETPLALLEEYANKIDSLSPTSHASMGYESDRLVSDRS